ncbi:DoxX family protein [Actinophytocola algeriensis]|uniref:Putative membrane protein YphA (DoxX/SURF4 family) n=1 Tax=Actinophytocola algeriensis TaxID=1768010 RepID=A0A7W7Q0H5_9PSEU|nr:DoxX family membrane protein [Actinophytocola algeriensis]MBB4904624.1 putative membrane protein YphA (DoxX/SURF4 family) [Actinophytocola algeriensis]MBE1476517.1 putative membrane protein YphA (DoxX/SURF4 family) [Actinophytocola algeriensis]
MDVVALIGRILFALLFLGSAFGHLAKADAMAGYAASRGLPQPKLAVLGSGVLMLVGALLVLLGIWIDLGALLLVIFLIPTAVLMHPFWKETDAMAKQNEMIAFQKDIALAGAALLILALYAGYGSELGITITGPLF